MHRMNHGKRKNKFVAVLLAVLCFMVGISVATVSVSAEETVATSGSCGSELTWSFHAGTLTIAGKGEMTDFTEPDMAPWYALRKEISRVVFPEDLTSIGDLAFYECTKLKTVILPENVRTIGHYSFAACDGLESLYLGQRVREIGNAAFYGCLKLQAVTFPYGMENLGYQAFYRCESIATVTIPPYLTKMGSSVFAYCKNLVKAEINASLTALPEWTFYGCERLSVVVLPDSMKTVENYAFKRCDDLISVYFSGDEAAREEIQNEIESDVPLFAVGGYVGSGAAPETNLSSKFTENEDGTVTQENVTVRDEENMTLVSTVVQNRPAVTFPDPGTDPDPDGGSASSDKTFSADISVTVENKDGWEAATNAVKNTLKDINEIYAGGGSTSQGTSVTVYIKGSGSVDETFLKEMAERDITLTVVTADGSSWKMDCSDLVRDNLTGKYNYAYTIEQADAAVCEKLGTDLCYRLRFTESAEINAEIYVQLPSVPVNSNAFLYQIEADGSYTRLQAVAVESSGRAHFYLASVDRDTQYIIGLNVPSESTDDVIIPDELMTQYGNAVERLEKIEFQVTGVNSSWGLSFWQVTGILVAVLVVVIGGVGAVMFAMNKQKMKLARSMGAKPGTDGKGTGGKGAGGKGTARPAKKKSTGKK